MSYKGRSCEFYWRIYGITTEKQLYSRRYEDEIRLLVKNRNEHAQVSLGLVKRPVTLRHAQLNTYDNWQRYTQAKGYIETIEDYLCPYNLGSFKSFDYTKRIEEKHLHFEANSTKVFVYFQLVAQCNMGSVIVYYDRYKDIELNDGTKWDEIDFSCLIPFEEGVIYRRVKYYCTRFKDATNVDFSPPKPPPATTERPTRGSTFRTTRVPFTYETTTTGKPKLQGNAIIHSKLRQKRKRF